MKALGITAGALTIPGIMAACSSPSSNGGAPGTAAPQPGGPAGAAAGFYNGIFTTSLTQNPQGLDPQVSTLTESYQVMLSLYEQLVEYDPCSDSFYPQLLAQMPDMSDTSRYVCKLRDGLKFHNGAPVTAEDVKYTFDFILQMGAKSPAYGLYAPIKEVKVLDPLSFEFNLHFGYGLFVPYLASIMGGIVRKGAREEKDIQKNPSGAGCGAFTFKEWIDGDHLTLERYKDYHDKENPAFQTLVYKVLVDESARSAQLMAGTIDFCDDVPKKDFKALIDRPDIDGKEGLSEKVAYVQFNFKNQLFQNKDLRKALSYAVDREAILHNVFSRFGEIADGPMKPGTKFYDPKARELAKYDPEKARFHLKQAGYEKGITFDVLTQNNQRHIDMTQLIQDMWKQVGITANVIPMEKTALFAKAVLGNPDWTLMVTDWSSSVYSPDYMLKLVYESKGSFQRSAYSNLKVDEMLAAAMKSGNEAEQKELFSKISMEMAEDTAAIFICWESWTPAWRSHVKNFCPAPTYYEYYDKIRIAK